MSKPPHRFIDRVLASGLRSLHDDWHRASILNTLRQAKLIVADEASRYYFEEDCREFWDLSKDFPNVAPPYPTFWVEAQAPRFIRTDLLASPEGSPTTLPYKSGLRPAEWGALFVAHDLQKMMHSPHQATSKAITTLTETDGSLHLTGSEAAWALEITMLASFDPPYDIPRIVMAWLLGVNADGSMLMRSTNLVSRIAYPFQGGNPVLNSTRWPEADTVRLDKSFVTYLHPLLLAINWLHCKNVTLEPVVPDKYLTPNQRRKGHRPPLDYHIIKVDPFKPPSPQAPSSSGLARDTHAPKRYHEVRAHFATYDEKPLFGRIKGTFWVPRHYRGDISVGMIESSVELTPTHKQQGASDEPQPQPKTRPA